MKKRERVEEEIKGAFRVAKTNKLIEAACLVILGLVLLIWSGTALIVICKAIAAIIAIVGIVTVVTFFYRRSRVYGSSLGLFGGVVALVMGMYLFFNPEILASLGPTIIGLIVLVTGMVDLSESIRIVRQKSGGVAAALVIAVAEIVLGVIFIIHPVAINKILMKFMAIALIADGIADIWIMFQIGKAEKPVEAIAAVAAGDVIDAEVTPLQEESAEPGNSRNGKTVQSGAAAAPQEKETMEGYTTISHHHEESAADEKKPADGVNGVEQDAAEAGVLANQEPFGTENAESEEKK